VTLCVYSDKRAVDPGEIHFKTRMDSQHAVNSILMQEEGKMKAKDLRQGDQIVELHCVSHKRLIFV